MKCLLCGSEKLDILTERIRGGKEGCVYYCPKCDYGMFKAEFKDASEYYDKEYRKKFKDELTNVAEETPEKIYQMRTGYQKDRIDIIKDFFDKEKSFLEIGSSAGQFLEKIRNEFATVEGIELSTSCAEYVRQRWGLSVYSKDLAKIEWDGKKFDYVGFFQVLEHIENPKQFLYDVHERLKKGGKVFIEIPTLDDPLRKLWNVSAYEQFYYHEAHLSYFSEKSIESLLKECGYRIDNIYYIQDYNFLNHLYWFFNNKPQETCTFGLNEPSIDFKDDDLRVQTAGNEINELLTEMNERYFEILSRNKLTSNIFVVASKIEK